MNGIDRRGFLRASCGLLAWPLVPPVAAAPARGGGPAPRHAALRVYTQPLFRPRHEALVRKALEKRAAAHTSGWARGKGDAPILAVGKVPSGAGLYHEQKLQGGVYRTWPFAVVLEYDGNGKPRAFLDWFRRSKDSADPGAWLLDPGVGYAEHHNAQVVAEQDELWSYLAVVDTPTDTHVGGTEWAVRARVAWADGSRVQKGWWLRFLGAPDRPEREWRVDQTPLVDWRLEPEVAGRGVVATAPVTDPDRELAVLGTRTVFRFPEVPPGVEPGTGRR